MKKLVFAAGVFAFAIALNLGTSQESKADMPGPFLGQGHWVELGGGGEECMTHWWSNNCKVGDTRP